MPDDLDTFFITRPPTPERPLLGLTVLVVEDSLFASEAMRLLCLRSGARIRRADSLKSAYRHLSVYRPMVIIVDLGLPDGSGAELIREVATAKPRVPVILGISGDAGARAACVAAGADGFLEKPVESLAVFQNEVLRHLPKSKRPRKLRALSKETISPDPLALREDLTHIAELLNDDDHDEDSLRYVSQFLWGLARLVHDTPLTQAIADMDIQIRAGRPVGANLAQISALVGERLLDQHAVLG